MIHVLTLGSCRAKVIEVSKCWDLKTSWLLCCGNCHIKCSQLKSKTIISLLIIYPVTTLQALPGLFMIEACSAYQLFQYR